MLVTIQGKKVYIDYKNITAVYFEPTRDEYNPQRIVIHFYNSQMSLCLKCESEAEALDIIKLIEKKKSEEKQTNEIDDFKNALEYAIKIVKG